MATYTLKVEVTGDGPLNNCYIYLERLPTGEFPIQPFLLQAKNSLKKSWLTDSIHLDVVGKIDFQLHVFALWGTGWAIKLSEKRGSRWVAIYENTGETGDSHRTRKNVSILRDAV